MSRFFVMRPDGLMLDSAPGIDRVSALWNAAEVDPWLARHMKRNGTGNLRGAQRKGYCVLEEADLPALSIGEGARSGRPSLRDRFDWVLAFTFGGLHNVGARVDYSDGLTPWGNARAEVCVARDLGTFDADRLTRLVVAAHDQAVRVEILPDGGPGRLRLVLWTRDRDGSTGKRHPTLEQALERMAGRAIWDGDGPAEVTP